MGRGANITGLGYVDGFLDGFVDWMGPAMWWLGALRDLGVGCTRMLLALGHGAGLADLLGKGRKAGRVAKTATRVSRIPL